MARRQTRYFVGDFETTVYTGQTSTEVWASALVELYTENVTVDGHIDDTFQFLAKLKENVVVYYHNLKFDGSFWLSYLLKDLKFTQAYTQGTNENDVEWLDNRNMKNKSFKYVISSKGQWYTITIKVNNKIIEIRDSLKLLPFSVKRIGKAFKTKRQKLEMEYKGFRYAGCKITEEELEYIKNDVLVVKEALEITFEQGHDKLTIGACCLEEYKNTQPFYDELFPDLTSMLLDEEHTYPNVDAWLRKSYKGGWCYVVKGCENVVYGKGSTADVNSLYPSVMSSQSGNRYPVGNPHFWSGDFIPDEAIAKNKYFFVRVRTKFKIKEGYLPFIQIKGNLFYDGTEMLETSEIYDAVSNRYYDKIKMPNGSEIDSRVELTLTMTDYHMILEHYYLYDFEIVDGCWFFSEIGIFDAYIDKYKYKKMNSTGALRELAKLFLNNLYGKMASSTDSSFKVAFLKEDGVVGFKGVFANNKKAGFIAVGSAITSYARNFTISVAQMNFHGADKAGFKYADTDSIHCTLSPEEIKGITAHPTEFCCWNIESEWDEAIFARQKTYIEHITGEDKGGIMTPVDPFYNIKCAGMPQRCKDLLNLSLLGADSNNYKLNEEEKRFVEVKRTLQDFQVGLCVPSKLMPKRVEGGILLVETNYKMRA